MKKSPVAPLFETDAYKLGHVTFYPEDTQYAYSHFTNRASKVPGLNHVVAFGLQAFIQNYIMDAFEDFFAADEDLVADLYEKRVTSILGPNNIGSDHIRKLHRLGYLPLNFRTVKEGTLVPVQLPTITVENTHPDFAWLVGYVETVLSASIWHPSTSATDAAFMRHTLEQWAERQDANKDFIDWQWHDFSFRGQTSPESAAASGAAHLISFLGTDNLNAFEWIDYFYPGDNGFLGGSVSATEHSVMTARGREHEFETYEYLLEKAPTGILSVVSDTWDLWNVLENIIPALKERILGRDGKLVIRPDSGDPADILCGTVREFGKGVTAEEKGTIELLWETFGGTVNSKGLKTLDPHIGAIYGDSITPARVDEIFSRLEDKGFAMDNLVFGAGSYFYQMVTRDQFSSCFKNSSLVIDGVAYDRAKDPATGHSKKSAAGRLAVHRDENNELILIQHATPEQEATSELQTVWKDGQWTVEKQSFADIRAHLKDEMKRVFG